MFHTINELHQLFKNKKASVLEVTTDYLTRIKRLNPTLNAYITLSEAHALAQATAADQCFARGEAGLLTGIPIGQKDLFCTKNIKTSCGSKMLDNFIAPYDAHIVERFNEQGAVMLGKLNMDEFGMGSSNENSYYGPVKNPWDMTCTPGGSSGGSAAAVAAGLALAATGTDTGGSIRQPAALCGLTGLKPTYGRVSRHGLVAFASSLDQAGPLARSAEDCAHLLQAMAGFDERDSTSVDVAVPDYAARLNDSLEGIRIGIPRTLLNEMQNKAMVALIEDAMAVLQKLGARFVDITLPNGHLALPAYYVIAPAEASSNLARYDGVRYGHRCKDPTDLTDLYRRSRQEGFGYEVKRRIMIGTYVLSSGYYDAYYQKAQQIRRLISDDFQQAFDAVDLILSPTTPHTAFALCQKAKNPLDLYLCDIYTLPISLAGLPALSLPVGFVNALPVGLQLIGNHFQEARLLNAAHRYQTLTDWHAQHPSLAA